MQKSFETSYSILIVSSSEQLVTFIKKVLPKGRFNRIEVAHSASQAKRELVESAYDIVLVSSPLPDEMGVDFAMDVNERYTSSVLLAVPGEVEGEVTSRVIDYGVITIPKPLTPKSLDNSVRIVLAFREKFKKAAKKVTTLEDKMEEIRIVNRAKLILVEKEGMSEDEAHRYIGKSAMDRSLTRRQVSEEILAKFT
ncbi:MAG: ANTAR domain-containing protein [Eubacterium sp.]|nr:ANTAR domain-containing protein [Eubacterium sp.]